MTTKTLALSPENLSFLQKLKQLDFGPIAHKLMHSEEEDWTEKKTRNALMQYMSFLLLLHLYPNQNIIPTTEIDKVWHHHILTDINKYINDCEMLFGRLINHSYYPQSEDDLNTRQIKISQTQELFQKHFEVQIFAGILDNKFSRCEPPLGNEKSQKTLDFKVPKIEDYLRN